MSEPAGQPAAGPAHRPGAHEKPSHAPKREEYERLAEQAAQYKDQYLRAVADFDNAKKRLERDRQEYAQFASERILKQLLPILDSFEQALNAMQDAKEAGPSADGVRLIFEQLKTILEKEGLKRIESLGKPFDHHVQEAVGQVERDGVAENTVVEEVRSGYTLNGRAIRLALVKVAKQAAESSQAPER